MQRWSIIGGLWLLLCGGLRAQGDFWACPRTVMGQTLRIYNWTTYIAEDTISNFETLCGVTVRYDTFIDENEMIDVLRAGNPTGYDVTFPTDAAMFLLRDEALIQPLDFSRLPNFANIDVLFRDRAFDPGNVYSVPYTWGTVGVGYRRAAVPDGITSWADVWAAPARVAWYNDDRLMFGIALNALGLDPNTTDPTDLQAAAAYLIENSDNLAVIADDDGQDQLAAGQVDIVIEYSGDVFQIIDQCRCDDFAYVIPQEGAYSDVTNMTIPVNAQNPVLAHLFLDYMMDRQVAADVANATVYGSPNRLAVEQGLIYQAYLTNPAIYPPRDVLAETYSLISYAAMEEQYGAVWADVRETIGQ